jgi:phospholipid-transporting ATPase
MLCTQVIYVFTAAIFNQGLILTHGWIGGQWVWGTTLYLTTLLLVLGKAALISEYVLSLILTKASPA